MPALNELSKPMTASTSPVINDVPALPSNTLRSNVVWVDVFPPKDVPVPRDFQDLDEVISQEEKDETKRHFLEKARVALSAREPERIVGLAALRLRKGWSQKRLADEVGTSQPHIARLEGGDEDILMSTARRLAAALGTSIEEIDAALQSRGKVR
jgi:DNA-binding XRE family transcriptional regulator